MTTPITAASAVAIAAIYIHGIGENFTGGVPRLPRWQPAHVSSGSPRGGDHGESRAPTGGGAHRSETCPGPTPLLSQSPAARTCPPPHYAAHVCVLPFACSPVQPRPSRSASLFFPARPHLLSPLFPLLSLSSRLAPAAPPISPAMLLTSYLCPEPSPSVPPGSRSQFRHPRDPRG